MVGKHHQVDDYPIGGEAGMVIMIEPVFNLINKLKSERNYDLIIYTSLMENSGIKKLPTELAF
jgi:tRNA (guanine37-N1)-methyltransferase